MLPPLVYWGGYLALIAAQIFLATRKHKLLGWIVPALTFLGCVAVAIASAVLYDETQTSFPLYGAVLISVYAYVGPLLLFIAIYFICRFALKRRNENK